jgi:regulator of protease activity HflC (stomatin/prohibitin superfamily)
VLTEMGSIIIFTFLVAAAIAMAVFLPGRKTTTNAETGVQTHKNGLKMWAWIPVGFAFLTLLLSLFTIVPTREIGVVTSFGRPVKTLPNGLHAKAPWQSVHVLDGTIQTDNHTGVEHCTDIRIGNESTACIDNTIRWRIRLDAGKRLYQDYRELENIRDSLVTRELKAALNEVLSNYNPLDQIKDNSAGAPDLNQFSRQITTELRKLVGQDVEVLSVILPIIRFDEQTQSKINAYQAEVANTRIAEQKILTNKAQAQANAELKQSVSNEPNVLVAQCMDILDAYQKKNIPPPIGFSCWPGGSATSVVIPKP